MVQWQQFVSLCFQVKRERGNDVESLQESQEVLGIASDLWQAEKSFLRNASDAEALNFIRSNA